MITTQDNFVKEHVLSGVSHLKEITLVKVLSKTCIVTAGLDKMIKIWHLPEGCLPDSSIKITLVAKFKVEKELIQLQYNQHLKQLAYLDCECTLGVVQVSDAILTGEAVVQDDDIDFEAIDAAMAEEEDIIDMDDMKDALDEA